MAKRAGRGSRDPGADGRRCGSGMDPGVKALNSAMAGLTCLSAYEGQRSAKTPEQEGAAA